MRQTTQPVDNKLVQLVDLSLDALCIAGSDGCLRFANPAFARLLGYTQEQLLARPFMDNVHPADVESACAVLGDLAAGNNTVGFECRQVCADGSVRWFEWNTSTQPEEGLVYGVARDVTDRRAETEQLSALRRVATLVAEGTPPAKVLSSLAEEVKVLLGARTSAIARLEADEAARTVASSGPETLPLGTRIDWPGSVFTAVIRTGRPARKDDYEDVTTGMPGVIRSLSLQSSVAAPIIVEGALWGAIGVGSARDRFPVGTESRLEEFTRLAAAAVASAQSRQAIGRLADEQAALRRVATLVARDASRGEVFDAVAKEVGKLLDTDITVVGRYDSDGAATAIGSWSALPGGVPVGTRSGVGGRNVLTIVAETEEPARVDGYDDAWGEAAEIARRHGWRSSIAAPIIVEGRLWGVMLVATQRPEPFPGSAEERLSAFTDLVATAIANAESREARAMLTEEQAALRRVATLVAQGVSPQDLFDAVAEQVGPLLPAANVSIGRYEPDDSVTSMASWSSDGIVFPPGVRWPIKGTNVAWMVLQTGRPARIDDFSAATDSIGVAVREAGYTSAIGSPIAVEGRLWGVISAASTEGPMPPGTEARLTSFTELVATAIANTQSKSELAASRRRIVAGADEARRRIERDLHDGIQQRLIALTLRARAMTREPADELPGIAAELSEGLKDVSDELREVSRGIHPTILTEAGLGPALRALARRSNVPVDVDIRLDERLPAPVEAAAYYVASEALTNVAKHAQANVVELNAARENGVLTLEVRDDGIGGVDAGRGSGILGLTDRVEALGGTMSIASPQRGGTTLLIRLPIAT